MRKLLGDLQNFLITFSQNRLCMDMISAENQDKRGFILLKSKIKQNNSVAGVYNKAHAMILYKPAIIK